MLSILYEDIIHNSLSNLKLNRQNQKQKHVRKFKPWQMCQNGQSRNLQSLNQTLIELIDNYTQPLKIIDQMQL